MDNCSASLKTSTPKQYKYFSLKWKNIKRCLSFFKMVLVVALIGTIKYSVEFPSVIYNSPALDAWITYYNSTILNELRHKCLYPYTLWRNQINHFEWGRLWRNALPSPSLSRHHQIFHGGIQCISLCLLIGQLCLDWLISAENKDQLK